MEKEITTKIEKRLAMGKWFVTSSPDVELITPCLGSCVAVCLYDVKEKIGGMAHVVFPKRNSVKFPDDAFPSARYGDEVLELLIREINKLSVSKKTYIVAKIAGGAHMFQGNSNKKKEFLMIGKSNIESIQTKLAERKIPIRGSDVGGTCGRTVKFDIADGSMNIRRIGENEYTKI